MDVIKLIKEELDKFNFDKFFNKKILNKKPEYLYHLCPSNAINDVKINGLQIKYSKQHKFINGIYLADSLYTASNYSFLDENRNDYFIIEIPFSNLNTLYMMPDDYEVMDLLEDEKDEYIYLLNYLGIDKVSGNEKYIWNNLDYRHSLYICGQLLYIKDIPSKLFSKIYNKEEIKKILR